MKKIKHTKKIQSVLLAVMASIFLVPNFLYGQEDCSAKLKQAEKLYEEGNIEDVESIIKPCIDNESFTKAEKEQAFKLLTKVGLFEDNFSEAERNMILLLKTNPDFEPKQNDPIEMKDLYAQFRTDALFRAGVKLGLNSSYPTLLKYYSVSNSENLTFYENRIGFQAIADLNLMIFPRLMWNFEPSYTSVSFENLDYFDYENFGTEGNVNFDQSILNKETQSQFALSTGLKFDLNNKRKLTPYLISGVGINFILKTNSEIERSYLDLSGSINADKKTLELLKDEQRVPSYFHFNYGMGLKYKVGRGNLVMEARHIIGLNNVTDNRYQNELIYRYNYILDDITVNSIQLSVGYIHSIYRPKILKRKSK